MKERLIAVLETFCPNNVYLQGAMNPEEAYPHEFLTFWTNYTADAAHFDNSVAVVDWNISVMYYSDDPTLVNTKPRRIAAALKAAGFIPHGKGNDILSDEQSHTGWAMDFVYLEHQ